MIVAERHLQPHLDSYQFQGIPQLLKVSVNTTDIFFFAKNATKNLVL